MKLRMYTRKLDLQHSETHFEMLSAHFVTVLVQSVVVSQIRKEHLMLNSNVCNAMPPQSLPQCQNIHFGRDTLHFVVYMTKLLQLTLEHFLFPNTKVVLCITILLLPHFP